MVTVKGFGKLAVKGLLVLAPMLALWVYIWAAPMRFVDGEIPNYIWNRKTITQKQPCPYDVIILGDSMSNAAFAPEILSEKTLDLALGGQTAVEQYYVLREYLKHNPAPKVCYISFNDGHLVQAECFFSRTMYSHILPLDAQREIYDNAKRFKEKKLTEKKEYASYELRAFHKYLPSLVNAGLTGRRAENEKHFRDMTKHRGTYIARGVWEYTRQAEPQTPEFKIGRLFDFYYHRLIELCGEYHIKVRLIKLPEAVHAYGTDYAAEREAYYREVERAYPYVMDNWLRDGFAVEDFGDTNHLNNHGSYKFSQLIKSMYPEDFADDSPISRETIDGLTDYLQMENDPGYILRWMEGRNFSALFLVRRGGNVRSDAELAAAIDACGYDNAFRAPVLSASGTACYYAAGDHQMAPAAVEGNRFTWQGAGWEPITLTDREYTMDAQFPGEKNPRTIVRSNATDLSVIILNNYDHKVVAEKNFLYMHGRYVLMKD